MLCLIMEFFKIKIKYNDSDFTMKHPCEDYVINHHCYRRDGYKTHTASNNYVIYLIKHVYYVFRVPILIELVQITVD